jgi:zinc and cadmium transporter
VGGGVIALLVGSHDPAYAKYLLPLTAGGFLYIAGSDLIPELHHDDKMSHSFVQLLCMVGGMALMALLVVLEGAGHACR